MGPWLLLVKLLTSPGDARFSFEQWSAGDATWQIKHFCQTLLTILGGQQWIVPCGNGGR